MKMDQDHEIFMQDLEEDPDYRQNINLYQKNQQIQQMVSLLQLYLFF